MGTIHLGPVVDHPRQRRGGASGDLRPDIAGQGKVQVDTRMMADAKRLNNFGCPACIAEAVDVAARDQMPGEGRSIVGIETVEDPVPLAGAQDQLDRLDPRFPIWRASRRCLKRR